jgi:hypothetical protein
VNVHETTVLTLILTYVHAELTDDPLTFKIHVVPNQDGQDNHVALSLKCTIPASYPDEEPQIEIVLEKGLTDSQLKDLKQIVAQQVSENMGMAMMYTVSEALREYLVENNREGNDGSEYQEMMRRMEIRKKKDDASDAADALHAANVAETVKRNDHGTPVTVESFMVWRAAFEREMQTTKKESLKDDATAKLTGRQLWSRGLAKDEATEADDDDEDDEDDEDYVEGEDDDDEDDEDYEEAPKGGKKK